MSDPTPPMSKDWLAVVADLVTKVGVPTVIAGVLLWYLLHRIDHMLDIARATQLEMHDMLQRCCAAK